MRKEDFKAFKECEPDQDKYVIVTNNINARDAFGNMSHVWLTDFIHYSEGQYSTFIDGGCKRAEYLTHWKYA